MSEKKTVQTICLVAREEDGQVKVRFLLQEANEHVCIRALREGMCSVKENSVFSFFFRAGEKIKRRRGRHARTPFLTSCQTTAATGRTGGIDALA